MGKGPLFTRIKNESPQAAQQAIEWFKSSTQKISGASVPQEIERESEVNQEELVQKAVSSGLFVPLGAESLGRMFLFKYDPKYKERLPYYDSFPLVFPIGSINGGFMAINLHYLPFGFRIPILNQLGELSNDNDKYDDAGRLEISYGILKDQTIIFDRFYKNCIKKYLYAQVRSQFNYVSPKSWNLVANLPFERWDYRK